MASPKACVQCGKCLEVCPLFKATGREELTPRAKFFLQSLDPAQGLSVNDFNSLASLCLSCGRCAKNCPQNMSGPELVSELRAGSNGFLRTCWDIWLASPGVLWPTAAALSRFSPESLPEPFGSAKKRMASLFAKSPAPWAEVLPQVCFEERKAVLFKGCVGRYARKDWASKAEHLMDAAGLVRPGEINFSCCGSSYGSAGLLDRQRDARKKNIRVWQDAGEPLLVTFCATCLKGLKEYDVEDFSGSEELRSRWMESLTPLSSLLAGAEITLLDNCPDQVIYHKPCHAAQPDADLEFVQAVAGDRLLPVKDDLCCGFGGVMQIGAPKLSRQVGEHCMTSLTEGADAGAQIVSGCSACVIQLATLAKDAYFATHWLDILK
ncbi:(Fe-S)-binding protein [Maridesulfovibrio sp.]|uniref:(Fe-S)-binding protein n=1 Tax=Maridesulfovibrio sp. TaxID=2795000 RepID=UPI002A18BCDE|nr:(Fe-S)-binding protein [Maridesulfovibrio sp.]